MDLNEPLGMKPPAPRVRGRVALLVWSGAVLTLAGVGVFLATADPHGGEPYAVATIPPAPDKHVPVGVQGPDPSPTGSLPMPDTSKGESSTIEDGVRVVRGGESSQMAPSAPTGGGPLIIDVTKVLDDPFRKKPADGGANNQTAPSVTAGVPPSSPRVAIFVEGMGLSDKSTRTATETMPPAVDLAFLPYGATIGAAVAAAKARGHEILLQIPMETTHGAGPGPHALRADEPQRDLAADIDWLTSRFSGYAGVSNLLGASVTSNASTMTTLLKSVASSRLFYLDDGTSKRSIAASLGPGLGLSVLQADVILDATSDPNVVRANFDRLEAIARQNGQAIGMASGLPDHLAQIARLANDLGGHGIVLVPVSAFAGRPANVATTR